jgi:molybdopterin-containing oxidoreductase family membrane subunit
MLFSKYFPVIAIAEIKHVLKRSGEGYKKKMEPLEKETVEEFAHNAHH